MYLKSFYPPKMIFLGWMIEYTSVTIKIIKPILNFKRRINIDCGCHYLRSQTIVFHTSSSTKKYFIVFKIYL